MQYLVECSKLSSSVIVEGSGTNIAWLNILENMPET